MLIRVCSLLAVLTLGVVLAGCSNMSGDLHDQIHEWSKSAGLASIESQIASDLTFLTQSEHSRNLTAIKTNCEGFPGDVEALYETLPTPDSTLTNEFNNASQDWFAAASSCASATSLSSRGYSTYLRDVANGERAYAKAKKRLSHFGVG